MRNVNRDKIKLLHITNSYGGTKVYKNLYAQLDSLNIIQKIFVPLNPKNRNRPGKQMINFKESESGIYYSLTLKSYHKYLYFFKIRNILKALMKSISNVKSYDLIHASTLCLDGAVAYRIWKKYKIPYIITIRNTDINLYYKKLFWKRNYFHQILLNASLIVFISNSYRRKLFTEILPHSLKEIEKKSITIPNGISSSFLLNRFNSNYLSKTINIVYVGGIQENKNIHSTILAIDNLRQKGYNITYTVIGKNLDSRRVEADYIKTIERFERTLEWVKILERQSQDELINTLRNYDIFVMPSITETFGLVYVEALSQGLPIIYTKNQGFDGFYEEGYVGYSVEARNINDIAGRIEKIIKNYTLLSSNIKSLDLTKFDWEKIAYQYKEIYTQLIRQNKE